MHELNTPWFKTFAFVQKFLYQVGPFVFSVTEAEANFLGYAVHEVWALLGGWLRRKGKYLEAYKKYGMKLYPILMEKSDGKDKVSPVQLEADSSTNQGGGQADAVETTSVSVASSKTLDGAADGSGALGKHPPSPLAAAGPEGDDKKYFERNIPVSDFSKACVVSIFC